jgi:hypothetical protein
MERPSLREGFLAVLGLGVHCETRCAKAPLKHVAMSQMWKRAARATPSPALLSAPYGTEDAQLAFGIVRGWLTQ